MAFTRDFTDEVILLTINELKIGQSQITTVTVRKYIFSTSKKLA